MKKMMYCASTFSHINNFHLPYIKKLTEDGYEVTVVAGGNIVEIPYAKQCIKIPFEKKLASLKNLKNIMHLRKILVREKFDVVSVHTNLAAALVRTALFLIDTKPYVINTVHGYLFGNAYGQVKNTLFLWIEKFLRIKTDCIVVMNNEDYNIAHRNKLYKHHLYKINGMGVDLEVLCKTSNTNLTRKQLGLSEEDIILIFVGEFSQRKNQLFLIEALVKLPDEYKLILLGTGDILEMCKSTVKEKKLTERIVFAGHQPQVADYYKISDICVSASRSEGLPFNIIEAMACGLPVVASNVKGHEDLVEKDLLFTYNDQRVFCEKVRSLDRMKREMIGLRNAREAKKYDIKEVLERNYEILR